MLSEGAIKCASVKFQPAICRVDVSFENFIQEPVKRRAVIEMDQMGNFVRDH